MTVHEIYDAFNKMDYDSIKKIIKYPLIFAPLLTKSETIKYVDKNDRGGEDLK